ncbi:MAG: hypothetical protein JNK46_00760 [Methylobacteriaceae bacterium]|nr:hypothetical protein [Methylobacteriaceae bacterium]
MHEIYAAEGADGVAALGFALAAMARAAPDRPLLWARQDLAAREYGGAYAPGLAAFGVDPARLIAVGARDPRDLLQAGLEGARCAGLGAALIELHGPAAAYDLVASRRLAFAAAESGARVVMLRSAAAPAPSAAETRWRLRAAPSRPLPAEAPGRPAFELVLLRQRNGQEGRRWLVEWNCDVGHFLERPLPEPGPAAADDAGPALSGAVVPLPALRADAERADGERLRRAG